MQSISVCMTPTADNNHVSIADWITCINSNHLEIFNFFQDCIDQGLILNKFTIDADGANDITTYYAIDVDSAKLFQNRFETQTLNFSTQSMSMKEFWNKFKFDIDISVNKIDFEPLSDLLVLVDNTTGEIWNTKFPLTSPYDHEGNLQ